MDNSRIWNRAAEGGAGIDWAQFTALEIHPLGQAAQSPDVNQLPCHEVPMHDHNAPPINPLLWRAAPI